MIRISEYDRNRRRRLLIIAPLVLVAHLLCFISFGEPVSPDRVITFGYQGPPKFEPEIAIIDNTAASARISKPKRDMLTAMNVFIEDEDPIPRAKGTEPAAPEAPKRREQRIALETSDDDAYRSYPSHAAVPYRDDYVILRAVKPDYPPDALANLQEGYVLVEAYVGENGTVNAAYVRSSYGPKSFETASLDAVRQFLFRPMANRGKPISFWVSFLVRFELKR